MTEMKLIRDEVKAKGKEPGRYTYGLIDMSPAELIQVIEGLKGASNHPGTVVLGERLLAFATKAGWVQVNYQVSSSLPPPPPKKADKAKGKGEAKVTPIRRKGARRSTKKAAKRLPRA